jgi:hypothetical protein
MIELFNYKFLIMIILIIISYLVLEKFNVKIVIIFLVILYFFKEYSGTIYKNFNEIIHEKYDYVNYNSSIEDILKNLKKYKKSDKSNYQEGMYYWKLFMKQIKILEHKDLINYTQYFDKAELYLKKSMNSFQSITVSTKEKTLLDGIKYGEYDYSLHLSTLIKDLYKEGYLLLYNISLRFNKKWKENPNIYNKQIILDYPLPNDDGHANEYY